MFSTIATLLVTATLLSAWTTALPTIESPVTGGGLVSEGGEGPVNGSIDGEVGIESSQGLIPEIDTWGPWSDEWSQCSRSCGGGVSYQERECITSRPGLKPNCVGPDRNYGSCNIQDCPEGSEDFRHEQCSKYNTEPFQGNLYTWVPYLGAENKCELNCMPKGKNFYYRISKQVIDGTPCESDKLDVCVNGECMKVGCDNMLGSNAKEDVCRECNGDGSSCKVVQGVFKRRKLPFGYNDILVLPAGAMNINITEVKPSNNFLALRNANGQYYINGNFSIDFPQPFQVADTIVYYERDLNSPSYGSEVIHALGPISEPLFVVLVTQERNYGISHSYAVPTGSEGAKPDTYRWVLEPFTECTRTCGGGYQLRNVWCARTRDYEASPEYLCDPTLKPAVNHSCNMISCPPSWFEGEWSPCSTSCGVGQQVRLVYCEQVMHGVRAEIIDDSFCQTGSLGDKPGYQQECTTAVCPEWKSGNWSQCSVTCGRGVQTRSVVCSSDEVLGDASCPADIQPDSQLECDLGPCENVDWLVSEWTDCSQRCGEGIQTRQLYCVGPSGTIYSEDVCNAKLRPDSTQQCSSMLACPPMWHASRWTECSTDCGDGVRIRNVFCAQLVDGEWKTAPDSVCNATIKLPTSDVCSNGRCVDSAWFTGPWGKCSLNCGGGKKIRQIMCFGAGLSLDGSACDMSSQPIEQESCNAHPCDNGEGGCATTAYGCCSDQTTPATGPGQEGCNQSSTVAPTEPPTSFPTCLDTAFGCCANDIDAASGPEGQGCEEGEPLETCELAQDTGACFAYGIKWFYDVYSQRCTQFWYGGCGGNDNRFDSELECLALCAIQQLPMAQEEICELAMEVGPCKASIESFFYNTESGECESFIYGGCHGNRNKFRTMEECNIKCSSMNKDPCSLQQDRGNCFETQVRWFYDAYSNQCEQFNYTGCLGNPNRFEDSASCEEKCVVVEKVPVVQDTVGVIVDVCGLPSDAGPCKALITQWAYNKDLNACQRFNYGGCEGNDNRFASEIECRHACVSIAAEECSMDLDSGPCNDYLPTWGFNKTVGLCQPFVYSGCEGNDNRFETKDACDHKCGPKAVTMCHRSRNYAFYTSQGNLGAFIPQCTLEGYFESMQCHGSTGYCWCVDMDGKEINGSRRAPGIHVQRPDCEALRPKMLTTCQRHLKQVIGKDGRAPPGRYVPQCTEVGEYETIQCYGSTGYCWCVNENGEEVEGSRRGPGMGSPNCHGGPQGPCPTLISNMQSGLANSGFNPQCTPNGMFVRVQCDGVAQCLCVNETTGDILKVLNEVPQDGDFDACNDAHEELTPCQQHRNSVLSEEELDGHIRYVPECTESGDYNQIQCYGDTGHCWCVNEVGEEIDGTRKQPGQGLPECTATAKGCKATREERLLAELRGAFIPDCTEEDLYVPTQCHGSTGHCWCVNEMGEEILETRRGPGEERIDCEDICSLPRVTGPCRGFFPSYGFNQSTGKCAEFIYGGCQGNGNRFQTIQACLIACTDYQPPTSTVSPSPAATTSTTTRSSADDKTTTDSSAVQFTTEALTSTKESETSTRNPSTTPSRPSTTTSSPSTTPSTTSANHAKSSTESTTTVKSTTAEQSTPPLPDKQPEPSTTQESTTHHSSMCEIHRQEALANTLPGVFIPQCAEDGSFLPKQCYGLLGLCWCVHEDGTEQGGTRVGTNEPLDCMDVCSMPEFRGQCPENIDMWFFNAEADVCEMFVYSGCQGNQNQFETQEACENRCITPAPTSCVEKREMALSSDNLGEFVPQCTADGQFTSQQCHGSIGHCWCVDDQGMELGATRRGPGEELLDCEDVCSLPKYSGPCRGNFALFYYDVMDGRCKSFVYGGCQGNGNRFETLEECEQTCYVPEFTGRPPTPCEIKRDETLSTHRLHLFVPECTADGAYTSRQCYDLIGQCWCVNEEGETQGGTKTRDGQVPFDCNDKCSFPKFTGHCNANLDRWFYNMETGVCEEFVYGGCRGNMNNFESFEECEQSCVPNGHEMQSCTMQKELALSSNLPDAFIPQCTEDGWFAPSQCHDSTGQCWCVTESGMEQGDTRREPGMVLLNCDDVCSFPKSSGPCLAYFAMWYYDTEERQCRQFIYGGCQGNGNRFQTQEECEQSCDAQVSTTVEPSSLCEVTKSEAQSGGLLGSFIPQCSEEGLFSRLQCHGSTGYCWCVDELTGEEIGNSAAAERFVKPDCDAYYRFDSIPDVVEPIPSDPTVDFTLNLSPLLGDEGCATTPFGCCPDGVTQATREDQFGCPGISPPMVEVAPSDSTVILGDTLTITCNSAGNPTPTTTWHRYDTNVEYLQDARITVTGEGTLTIEGVTEQDAGPYVCRASNGVGQAAKVAVDVKVFTPVEIPETSQHSLKVKEGDLVLLYCHAIGNPKPTVTWMRNDDLLPGDDPRMTQQEDDTLRIENVDLGDAGNYVCTGRNMFGTVQKRTVTLIVQAKVQIVTRPEDTVASIGETITLPCASIGSPKPTIMWRVNMIDLPSKDRFETSPNGDLTIRDIKSTDAGQYTCTAANGESVETAAAMVTVTGANSDPNCQDNSDYANCRLVLKAGMCTQPPFTKYCCATCRDNNHAKRRRRRRR
ncbi:papilin-like [Asterias rubens]|uniref:papilin-like n=1 Tax=Asterias rubens TaxID=7604 RepID=UPI0014554E98|nr:papilin-like [Asterias rubens]